MTQKVLINSNDQAVVIVIRPNGDPAVLINPRFGWQNADVSKVIRAIADRLDGTTPGAGANIVQSPSGS